MEETSSKVESLHAVAVAKGGPVICALCTRVCDEKSVYEILYAKYRVFVKCCVFYIRKPENS